MNTSLFSLIQVSFFTLVGFEETYTGCWVKKIFANGNAANTSRGDKLQVGDHLASVNGICVYKKTITEVCRVLANTAETDELQLTFIRYVGPIRNSNANEQQGYEVIDPHVKKSTSNTSPKRSTSNMSPVKLSKSLSSAAGNQPPPESDETKSKGELDEQAAAQAKSANMKEVSGAIAPTPKTENLRPPETKALKRNEVQVRVEHETKKKKRGFKLFRRRKDNKSSSKDKNAK